MIKQRLQERLVAELATFGVVGMACLAADILLFNLFVFGLGMTPLLAKSVGLVITGAMAFVGHRNITFRHRHGGSHRREVTTFVISTIATVVLSLVPLYVARHLFGVTSVVGLNVANLIGIALGTVARYLAYRHLVWSKTHGPAGPTPTRFDIRGDESVAVDTRDGSGRGVLTASE